MKEIIGFDRDEGNLEKNWIKHQVSNIECEEVFFNLPLLIEKGIKHSENGLVFHGSNSTNRLDSMVNSR